MTITLKQYPRCISDLFEYGLMYAVAEYKIYSPQPLTQSESWDFWTQPRSSLMEWLARTYPFKAQRISYLDRMLNRNHASGIETHYDVSNDFYALFLDEIYRF